ncbi:MAG: sigma-70 family RNA polymerase sigma factor [Tumebacillaceae bacterium]
MEEGMYELYRAYYEDLYRFIRQLEAAHGDLDALVQEVLLVANRHFPQYRGECGYKAWLFAVARQHLNSPWRKLLRRRKGQAEEIAEVLPADLEEDERERQRLLRELQKLFAELPRLEREVLVLRDLHEFSVREAGVILQLMDEKVRVLTERALDKVKARFPQPDQYQQAVRLLREVPSEPELRRKKAAMWEAFEAGVKQVRRRSKLRPVIWGTVGVAVVAAGVFGWRQVQGGEQVEQATTAPAATLQPVQTTMDQTEDSFGVKRVDLAPSRTFEGKGNQLFVENRILQIEDKQGTKTQLVAMDALDELHMLDIQPPYATLVIRSAMGEFRVYRVNLEQKTADLIPTEHQNVLQASIWEGAHGVALLMVDQESSEESVVVYDLDTGEAATVMQSKEFTYNRIDAKGDNLVLASERLIAVKSAKNGRLQGVANSLEPSLRYVRMTDEYLLYTNGASAILFDANADYLGKARVMKYDFHTGQSTNLLPGVEGEQWLLYDYDWGPESVDKYGVFVGNFVLTETVPDDSGLPPLKMGLQQIWRVLPNGERTKVFEEKQRWDHRGMQMIPHNPDSDVITILPSNGMASLFYNIKTGAVTGSTK